jgi:hypothetical protein
MLYARFHTRTCAFSDICSTTSGGWDDVRDSIPPGKLDRIIQRSIKAMKSSLQRMKRVIGLDLAPHVLPRRYKVVITLVIQ